MKDNIQEHFVPMELCFELKDLGFNQKCLGCYLDGGKFAYHPDSDAKVDAPLYSQAFEWILNNFNIHAQITSHTTASKEGTFYGYSYHGINDNGKYRGSSSSPDYVPKTEDFRIRWYTTEQAKYECLRAILKRLNQERDKIKLQKK